MCVCVCMGVCVEKRVCVCACVRVWLCGHVLWCFARGGPHMLEHTQHIEICPLARVRVCLSSVFAHTRTLANPHTPTAPVVGFIKKERKGNFRKKEKIKDDDDETEDVRKQILETK